ncbi:hypothetical protein EPUL_006191 [Erysiphe pulchra]|uniref:Phosphoinositide phospholipase C n=1 Tax=Erysiphe pulchra TaxID=225359 RepID=A0A2S4PLT6_9PEZI|nr:hypothetical protein EPUL_006191 [Erysiphe pulchra]
MTSTAINSSEENKLVHIDQGKDHKDERINEKERSTKQNNLTDTIKPHLRAVFDSLVKKSKEPTNKTLSQSHFEEWLLNVQGVPSPRDKLCQKKEDGYSFDEWLSALFVHGFLEAQKAPGPKDLTKTLSNYYISSSHNTYLSGNQLMSRSKTGAYKDVLRRGCRCIEVDVHNGDSINDKAIEESSANTVTVSRDVTPETSQTNKLSTRIATLLDRARRKRMRRRTEKRLADSNAQGPETLSQEQEKDLKRISSLQLSSDSSSSSSSSDGSFIESQVIPGEPIVMHGWTLTAPVGFRAVCKVIGQEAFQSSELPIIVSLEVHLDLEQQETMVKIMKEEWGDMLVQAPIPGCNPKETLPKLEQLKRKILIKVKKCKQQQDQQPLPNEKKGEICTVSEQVDSSMPKDSKVNGQGSSGNENCDTSIAVDKKRIKICESLSNLGIYTHTEHFSHSFSSISAQHPAHIFSIGESDLIDLDKNQRQELFTHNRNYIMRTYPAARRVDSSNPRPILFWRRGIQIVAMNWQKLDQGMMLNEGMFSGEQGWVLKPVGYHSNDGNGGKNSKNESETRVSAAAPGANTLPTVEASAEAALKAADKNTVVKIIYQDMADIKITILAGQHIPVPIDTTVKKFYPYICGELHLCEDDVEIRPENEQGGSRRGNNNNNNGMSHKYKQKTQHLEGDQLDFGRDGYQMNFYVRKHIQEDLSFLR